MTILDQRSNHTQALAPLDWAQAANDWTLNLLADTVFRSYPQPPKPADRGTMPNLINESLAELESAAREASIRAYCPYSKFPVGAALLTDDGAVFSGCNVENASYGLTICAERNAVFQMIATGQRSIRAVVIYTPTALPSAPCGACRQVLNEFGPNALVVSICDGPEVLKTTLAELLPDAFGPQNLA